jgi:hypothetical protein
MNISPASAALAGRLQYSAVRFSILAMSLRVASSWAAGALVFPAVVVADIIVISAAIMGCPALIMALVAAGFASFSSLSCSFSRVISCGLIRRKYSTTRPDTPVPVTSTSVAASRFCPPSLTANVAPCCPPAG